MIVYILSIFLSAFLLFQIQPMIAKYILPWFGGTPAVWSTVMLFFQVLLTGGYAYGHYLIGRIKSQNQWKIHSGLLAVSVGLMILLAFFWASPITPSVTWKPQGVETPIQDIFLLLSISVGLPYFMLSTNSPLMQSWFSRAFPGKSPYRLYSLSNFGSLLALVTYPILVEPMLNLRWQGWVWSVMYLAFAFLAGYAAFSSRKTAADASSAVSEVEASPRPKAGMIALWIGLSATASLILLAATNQITQEVAPIPFLWILPLTLYLLSFIFAFENERWYNRPLFAFLFLLATAGFIYLIYNPLTDYIVQIIIYSFLAFISFMICHGELYRTRPEPAHLTMFYLMVSVGGAIGGLFVNFVAPLIFKGYWELNWGIFLAWMLLAALTFIRPTEIPGKWPKFLFDTLVGAVAIGVLIFTVYYVLGIFSDALFAERNFYGVVRVKEMSVADGWDGYTLSHGITMHGLEFSSPDKRDLTTAYYTENGGAGLTILNHPQYGNNMKVGVLGLGIGTLAAYGQPGDEYRMYEINPVVIDLAEGENGYFHFLEDSKADIQVVPGDARISLERDFAATGSQDFDVLILDVFSSDSIPVHLITKEAFDLYLSNLAPEGILAVHISNDHLDLLPVLWKLKEHFGLAMAFIPASGEPPRQFPSQWVLLSRNPALLQNPAILSRSSSLDKYETTVPLWTDDYSNLFQILK